MAGTDPPGPSARSLLALWAAHRELSGLEWLEFRQALVVGLWWGAGAGIAGLTSWLGVNAAVFIALSDRPVGAALALAAANGSAMVLALWQARRRLWRPFFDLTQQEVAHDLGALVASVVGSPAGDEAA